MAALTKRVSESEEKAEAEEQKGNCMIQLVSDLVTRLDKGQHYMAAVNNLVANIRLLAYVEEGEEQYAEASNAAVDAAAVPQLHTENDPPLNEEEAPNAAGEQDPNHPKTDKGKGKEKAAPVNNGLGNFDIRDYEEYYYPEPPQHPHQQHQQQHTQTPPTPQHHQFGQQAGEPSQPLQPCPRPAPPEQPAVADRAPAIPPATNDEWIVDAENYYPSASEPQQQQQQQVPQPAQNPQPPPRVTEAARAPAAHEPSQPQIRHIRPLPRRTARVATPGDGDRRPGRTFSVDFLSGSESGIASGRNKGKGKRTDTRNLGEEILDLPDYGSDEV